MTNEQIKKELQEEKLKLTIEEIDAHECFKDWTFEKKLELISFVYELSLILYHSNRNSDE